MIVEYAPSGQIIHMVSDPVPLGLIAVLRENGRPFIEVSPMRLPDIQATDMDGNLLFDTIQQAVIDESGAAVVDEAGAPVTKTVEIPVMLTGRLQHVNVSFEDNYVDNGSLVIRPSVDLPAEVRLAIGETTSIALPKPCRILIDGEPAMVEEGVLELEGEMPAEYTIQVDHFPFKPATMKVIVE